MRVCVPVARPRSLRIDGCVVPAGPVSSSAAKTSLCQVIGQGILGQGVLHQGVRGHPSSAQWCVTRASSSWPRSVSAGGWRCSSQTPRTLASLPPSNLSSARLSARLQMWTSCCQRQKVSPTVRSARVARALRSACTSSRRATTLRVSSRSASAAGGGWSTLE